MSEFLTYCFWLFYFYNTTIKEEIEKALFPEEVEIDFQKFVLKNTNTIKDETLIPSGSHIVKAAVNDTTVYIIFLQENTSSAKILKCAIDNNFILTYLGFASIQGSYFNLASYELQTDPWINEEENCCFIMHENNSRNSYLYIIDFFAQDATVTNIPTSIFGSSTSLSMNTYVTKTGIAYIVCFNYSSNYFYFEALLQVKNGLLTVDNTVSSLSLNSGMQPDIGIGNDGCMYAYWEDQTIKIVYWNANMVKSTIETTLTTENYVIITCACYSEHNCKLLFYPRPKNNNYTSFLVYAYVENGVVKYKTINNKIPYGTSNKLLTLIELNNKIYIYDRFSSDKALGRLVNENIYINGNIPDIDVGFIFAVGFFKNSIFYKLNVSAGSSGITFNITYGLSYVYNIANSIKKKNGGYVIKVNSGLNLEPTEFTVKSFIKDLVSNVFDVYKVNIEMLFSSDNT